MLYVATVTGRTSLREPLYSPTWSSASVVLSSTSPIHCRVAVTLVVRISVDVCSLAMQASPTIVLPAPQGNTITPEPPRAAPAA